MADKLNPGEVFPDITLKIAGGGEMNIPSELTSPLNIVLFYRGHW